MDKRFFYRSFLQRPNDPLQAFPTPQSTPPTLEPHRPGSPLHSFPPCGPIAYSASFDLSALFTRIPPPPPPSSYEPSQSLPHPPQSRSPREKQKEQPPPFVPFPCSHVVWSTFPHAPRRLSGDSCVTTLPVLGPFVFRAPLISVFPFAGVFSLVT